MLLLKKSLKGFFSLNDGSEVIRLKCFQKYPNAGDVFSVALAKHYFPGKILPVSLAGLEVENLLFIGSILHRADSNSVVCGSGFMRRDDKFFQKPKAICCVRGPLTGHLLDEQGITHPNRFADPGVLAPMLFKPDQTIKHKLGIIPHYVDAGSPWVKACKKQGIKIIDVFSSLKKFFNDIQKCEVILSSSLHGLIFAHAYGKPAVWIELSDRVAGNGFKFFDYYQSVGVDSKDVKRIRVVESADPREISKMAEFADHTLLRETMEESIFEAKKILKL